MSVTVGRVNFSATLDGRGTPKDAERIGRQAGEAAGKGYDAEWSKSFRDSLTREGKAAVTRLGNSGGEAGTAFGRAVKERLDFYLKDAQKSFDALRIDQGFLDKFAKGFDDAGLAAGRLQEQVQTLREQNQISESQYERARRQIDSWAIAQRDAADATNASIDASEAEAKVLRALDERAAQHAQARENLNRILAEHEASIREVNREWSESITLSDMVSAKMRSMGSATRETSFHWKDLSHNTRQWTLIIGAVMAGMQDIAVLGSAAGGGLIALGGAATGGIAGIGGLAAVFVTLNKELDELPASLRPVVSDFQEFKDVFGDLRNEVAAGAFAEMPGVFASLEGSLRSLSPELRSLGASVGNTFDAFAEGTREGSEALELIRTALRLAGPNFESLAASSGTFGSALIRSFNRSQPVVEQFLGYVDTLADRFDAFSRSTGFDEWMRNTQTTFEHLGPLLDATGRMLNDLVTPESVVRSAAFLDNLTAFMPNLGQLLEMLGSLDVFGVLAQLLNDLGVGFAPLAPAAIDLAGALSQVAMIASGELGDALSVAASAAAPLVQSLADLLNAVPPDAWAGMANGALVVAGAFAVLKGAQGISGAVAAIQGYTAAAATATTTSAALGSTLKATLGKAGLWGIAIAGMLAVTEGAKAYATAVSGIEEESRALVAGNASLAASFRDLNPGMMVDDWDAVLNKLGDVGPVFSNIGLGFDETGQQALALSGTLKQLDAPLASLASTNLPEASRQFSAWATEIGATDAELMTMLESMPGFKTALENASLAAGDLATDEEILALALGTSTAATDVNAAAITGMSDSAVGAGVNIDDLASKIRNFGEMAFGSRDAAREYEASIDELTASLTENGTTLDITTEAGRENQAALDDLAQSVLEHTAATLEDTKSEEAARAVMEQGRQKLIEMADQFDMTAEEAAAYADELGLIPEDVLTDVELQGIREAEAAISQLVRRRTILINASVNGGGYIPGVDRPMASGGILNGPTRVLAGEAGAEAFIPLERPLHMIDPSVRWLAAIAQGKSAPAMASGGIVGGGRNLTIEAGAFQVNEVGDSRRTANDVLQRVVEYATG